MNHYMRRALLCHLVLLFALPSAFSHPPVATVHFVPFHIITYVPITTMTIEAVAHELWEICSPQEIQSLREFLKIGRVRDFNGTNVRGSVRIDDITYFIDSEGVVSVDGKVGLTIDKGQLMSFRNHSCRFEEAPNN